MITPAHLKTICPKETQLLDQASLNLSEAVFTLMFRLMEARGAAVHNLRAAEQLAKENSELRAILKQKPPVAKKVTKPWDGDLVTTDEWVDMIKRDQTKWYGSERIITDWEEEKRFNHTPPLRLNRKEKSC